MAEPTLDAAARALLGEARRAVLTTIDAGDGRPRSVPICYAVVGDALWSPLDEKPKASADLTRLRRVRNLAADPRATILADRWDEDWGRLAFVEIEARGELVGRSDPGHTTAVEALRARYQQYAGHRLEERPMLRFTIVRARMWKADDDSYIRPGPPGA